MMWRRVVPIGNSMRPVFLTLPTSENALVPLERSVPIEANHSPPWSMMAPIPAHVSTLLSTVGSSKSPFSVEWTYLARGSPVLPSSERIKRGRFTTHEGAATARDLDIEVKARTHDVLAQQPVFAGLAESDREIDHRQRILVADVDPTLVRSQGVGADDHPLEHRVRIALHDRAVLECSRVALVAVAEDEAPLPRGRLAGFPLTGGREPGSAAAALAGNRHLIDDFVGS